MRRACGTVLDAKDRAALERRARGRNRFAVKRLAGIVRDAPRAGRPATRRHEVAQQIVERTTQTVPKNATHWTVRTLAEELGASRSMVHRVWKANKALAAGIGNLGGGSRM